MSIITNFKNTCLLKGANTKFLRFKNNTNLSAKMFIRVDDIKCGNGDSGEDLKCTLKINGVPLDTILGKQQCVTLSENGERNDQVAYMLTCENEYCHALISFNFKFDNVSTEEYVDDEEIPLEVFVIKSENNTSKCLMNDYPLSDKYVKNDTASATLLRTNPMLTGNVKITVDHDENLFLNSMDANDILANEMYKNKKINYNSKYAIDLKNFIGSLGNEVLFNPKQQDYSATKQNLHDQVDDFYQYGVSQCVSKYYDEEYQFFAPLWLTKEIPEFFCIFRAKHPMTMSSYLGKGSNEMLKEILRDGELIKTFDMREGSKLGTYLRNIVNDALFTTDPIRVSMSRDNTSAWTGISYEDGNVTDKVENIYKGYIGSETTIKDFEEYITSGFKRQKLICQNIINLEFLFDDDDSEMYSINRYFGFYVNKIDLEDLDYSNEIISLNKDQISPSAIIKMNADGTVDNRFDGRLRLGIDAEKYSLTPYSQHNDNGIELPVILKQDEEFLADGEEDPLTELIADKNRFFVTADHDNNMYRVKSMETKKIVIDGELMSYNNFTLYNKDIELSKMCGINKSVFNTIAKFADIHKSQMQLAIYDVAGSGYCLAPNETITIEFSNASDDTDKWMCIANGTGLEEGENWRFPSYDISDSTYKVTFNPYGTPNQVAKSLAGALNAFNTTIFEAVAIDNKVAILSKFADESGNDLKLVRKFYNKANAGSVKIFDMPNSYEECADGDDVYYVEQIYFSGGNTTKNSIAVISYDMSLNLKDNYWFQVETNKYSKIKNYGSESNPILSLPYIGNPKYDDFGNIVGFVDYNEKRQIELTDPYPFVRDFEGTISAYDLFMPKLSLLSFMPVRDFDFNFFSSDSTYSHDGEIVSAFSKITLNAGEFAELDRDEIYYVVSGSGRLINRYDFEGSAIPEESDFKTGQMFETYTGATISFMASSDNTVLVKAKYNDVYTDNDDYTVIHNPAIDFGGFAMLSRGISQYDIEVLDSLKASNDIKRFTYASLNSEYDRLEENNQVRYATKSMVAPTINKWVSEGTDARDNKYRLNASMSFGTTNFSPSFEDENNPKTLTHEWLYLDEFPENFNKLYSPTSRNYMFSSMDTLHYVNGSKDNIKRLEKLMLDEKVDYFTKYFTSGTNASVFSDVQWFKKQEHYSYIHYENSLNSHFTLFHGVKVMISELNKLGYLDNNLKDYEGYKFSAVLSRLDDNSVEPYKITFYDNKVFKTLLMLVRVKMGNTDNKNGMSFLNLYNSKSSIDYSNVAYEDKDNYSIKSYPIYSDKLLYNNINSDTTDSSHFIFDPLINDKYGIMIEYDTNCDIKYGEFTVSGFPSFVQIDNKKGDTMNEKLFFGENPVNPSREQTDENVYLLTDTTNSSNFFFNLNKDADTSLRQSTIKNINKFNTWILNGGQSNDYIDEVLSFNKLSRILTDSVTHYEIKPKPQGDFSFDISFQPPIKIERESSLGIIIDENVGTTLMNEPIPGFDNILTTDKQVMYRYSGKYRPKFVDVIEFDANEPNILCDKYETDFLLCNTHVSDVESHGVIKDFVYNKVSENGREILEIDNYGKPISNYPYLGYTSLDREDRSIVASNWDYGYFKVYSDTHTFTTKDGSDNIKEFKSFLGSKLMNVPNVFYISEFPKEFYDARFIRQNSQNDVLSKVNTQVVEMADKLHIEFNLDDRLIELMVTEGADYEIEWVHNNFKMNSISTYSKAERIEYARNYLVTNILKLYEVKSIKVFAKQNADKVNKFVDDMSEIELMRKGFGLYLKYKSDMKVDSLDLDVDIILDSNRFYTFAVIVEIGRI